MSQEFDLSQGSQASSQGAGGGGGGNNSAAHRSSRDDAAEYRSGGDSSDTGGDAWEDGAAAGAADADEGDTTVVMRRRSAASSSSSPRHRSRRGGHPHPAPPPVVRYEDDQRQSKLREITMHSASSSNNAAAAAATAASPYGRASPAIAARIHPQARSPALGMTSAVSAPGSAPLLAAHAASPAPSAGGFSTGVPSPHLGLPAGAPRMSAIQKALAAVKAAQPPPLPAPQLQRTSPSPPAPAPLAAVASGVADGSEPQQQPQMHPEIDMTSPEVPAAFPALSPALGGIEAAAAAAACSAVAIVRPIVPISSEPFLGVLTQYSQASVPRARISAKSLVGPMSLVMPTSSFAAEPQQHHHQSEPAMLDISGDRSSRKKDKHSSSSKKHGKKSKSHKKDKHKRAHSTSSTGSSSSGAEGDDGKHKHKKKKNKHKHKSSSGVAAAAAIPGSSRVKLEHPAAGAAPVVPPRTATTAAPSRSPPDYPQSDADFFSTQLPSRLAQSLQSAAASSVSLAAKSKASTTRMIKSKETSIKDLTRASKKVSLSSSLGASLDRDDHRTSVIEDDVEEPSRSPLILGGGGSSASPHAKLTLSSTTTTPPRRQRVTDLLSSKVVDQDDEENQAGGESWSGGGGGSGSGDKRRGKGRPAKLGPLEQKLANAVATRNSSKRMKHQQHLHWNAANVLTGLPSPHNPDADSLLVRVLLAQNRFNVKFLIVSLCSPDVTAEKTIGPQSLMSPISVLPSSVSEVCRAVAKASNLPYASVPSSLLRIVMLAPSEFVEEGETASGHLEKLGDFPNCFLRLRQPFTYFRPEQCIPTIVNVRDWSRLLGSNHDLAVESEHQTWKDEQIRTDELMKADREAEAMLDAVGAGDARKNNNAASSVMEDVARQASELQEPNGGLLTDLLGPNPAVAHAASAFENLSLEQVERVLDINEREWAVEDCIFHPSLRPDRHHELMQAKQADRTPLSMIKSFSNPVEMLITGIVQKITWRGVNIAPNLSSSFKPAEGEAEAPAARFSKIELPSFFVQDASGGVVEVEVPLSMLPNWGVLLARGVGCFVQLLQLRQSSSWRATHSSDTMDSMQRSFQPWARDSGSFERRDIVLLTVTAESSFRSNKPGVGAPISMQVRRHSITVTPLLQIAQITSTAGAKRLDRVTLLGRVIHLENHAARVWKLYLTDESLKGSALTSTMMIELRESFHHAIFDTFLHVVVHSPSSANTFKLVDVAVGFDKTMRVPTLIADEFTDIVKIMRAPKDHAQLEKSEPMEMLAFKRHSKPIRKLNPVTRRLLMLPQHYHRALTTDRAVDMTLTRLLQEGHILTPLVQKHAIFVFEATIGQITMRPNVLPCCQHCLNLFPRATPSRIALRRECLHCHHLTELHNSDPKCWLHYLQVPVLIDALLHLPAADEATLPRITMQFEAEELQTLTNGWADGDKHQAFQNAGKLNESGARTHASTVSHSEVI